LKGNERADYLAKTTASYCAIIAYDKIPINRGKKLLEEHYTKMWNSTYQNSANASHTKMFIPSIYHRLSLPLSPNFLITQFLTNHGSFRSYLHKINKLPSPHSNCPENTIQRTHHLMFNCSLLSTDRPPALKSIPPPLFRQYHIYTIRIQSFLKTIFQQLQDELQEN
jgi:hypothetical protein